MAFERIQYLDWARRKFDESPPRFNLAASGMAPATPGEAGIDFTALSINGSNPFGHPQLRRSVGELYELGPERVLLATGTTLANFLIQAALVRPGDTVLCEWPAYEPLWRSLETLGAHPAFFKRDEAKNFAPEVNSIATAFARGARLCIMSDLHNPSGALLERDTVAEIARLAARYDAWLLVDEVYLSSVFDQTVQSAIEFGDRVIVTSSLTKTYGLPGLRAGWAIAPAAIVNRANDIFAHLGGNAPYIAGEAAAQAIAHLPQLRERAQRRRERNWPMVQRFATDRKMLVTTPAGAFIVWLKLPSGMNADRLTDFLLEKYETLVVPGSFFGSNDHIRVGYSGPMASVMEGLRCLGAAMDDLK